MTEPTETTRPDTPRALAGEQTMGKRVSLTGPELMLERILTRLESIDTRLEEGDARFGRIEQRLGGIEETQQAQHRMLTETLDVGLANQRHVPDLQRRVMAVETGCVARHGNGGTLPPRE